MLTVIVPLTQVDVARLKSELVAAGISDWPDPLEEPSYVGNGLMALLVPEGSDSNIVEQVVFRHVDTRTAEQVLKDKAKELIKDRSAQGKRDRARDRLTMEAIQGLMTWCNGLRSQLLAAGLPIAVPALKLRTWEQLEDRVRELIELNQENI